MFVCFEDATQRVHPAAGFCFKKKIKNNGNSRLQKAGKNGGITIRAQAREVIYITRSETVINIQRF